MWRWAALWHASTLLFVGASMEYRVFGQRHILPSAQQDCIDYSSLPDRNWFIGGFRPKRTVSLMPTLATYSTFPLLNRNEIIARRIDRILPNAEDIVKEHAKLVQDINSLRQIAFVKPLTEDSKDYDDTIFHDNIEVSTTARPAPIPTTTRAPVKATKPSSIPIILLGGASQNEIVRTSPMKFSKPISLVGTSVSPLMKHPYPFVVNGTPKPLKICMNPVHMMYTTTKRPGLLQRLLNSILPRGR